VVAALFRAGWAVLCRHLNDGDTLFVPGLGANDEVDIPQPARRGPLSLERTRALASLANAAGADEPAGEELVVAQHDQPARRVAVEQLSASERTWLDDLAHQAADWAVDSEVLGLISAQALEPTRIRRIEDDPRHIYSFVALTDERRLRAPALTAALLDPGRIVAVRTRDEYTLLSELHGESNHAQSGRTLFVRLESAIAWQLFWFP
jgi:hypothetical protein